MLDIIIVNWDGDIIDSYPIDEKADIYDRLPFAVEAFRGRADWQDIAEIHVRDGDGMKYNARVSEIYKFQRTGKGR